MEGKFGHSLLKYRFVLNTQHILYFWKPYNKCYKFFRVTTFTKCTDTIAAETTGGLVRGPSFTSD